MTSRQPFEAVLFDLDDTLHDDTYAFASAAEAVAREIAAEHGIDALKLKAAYVAESEGFWIRLTPDQLTTKLAGLRERTWANALREVGIVDDALASRSATRYVDYRRTFLTIFPGAIDLLRTLRARGVKVGMLTNGFAETHHDKIAELQLADEFDAIFIADEVGMIKPDPLLFAHACAKLGCAPARSAMVGDRYERDIRGALDAGLYAIWMNVHGETIPPGGRQPDVTVPDLAGVRAVLL
jgi:putative hydrolase of the HAD superfamily